MNGHRVGHSCLSNPSMASSSSTKDSTPSLGSSAPLARSSTSSAKWCLQDPTFVGTRTLSTGFKVLQGTNPLCKGSRHYRWDLVASRTISSTNITPHQILNLEVSTTHAYQVRDILTSKGYSKVYKKENDSLGWLFTGNRVQ